MNPQVAIDPTPPQLQALADSSDPAPLVMLNLLRFKDRADGIDAADGITGAEAYARYGAEAVKHIARIGGRVLLTLGAQHSVIGPDAAEWDMVIAVEYPSRRAFLEMISDADYLEAHRHRTAAVADSRLIACAQMTA